MDGPPEVLEGGPGPSWPPTSLAHGNIPAFTEFFEDSMKSSCFLEKFNWLHLATPFKYTGRVAPGEVIFRSHLLLPEPVSNSRMMFRYGV